MTEDPFNNANEVKYDRRGLFGIIVQHRAQYHLEIRKSTDYSPYKRGYIVSYNVWAYNDSMDGMMQVDIYDK